MQFGKKPPRMKALALYMAVLLLLMQFHVKTGERWKKSNTVDPSSDYSMRPLAYLMCDTFNQVSSDISSY